MDATMKWVGADPGGEEGFGLATLDDDGYYESMTLSCAAESLAELNGKPFGVGIDAPLWWSAGRGGSRLADEWLIEKYRAVMGSSVLKINSMRGACLVQGVLFAEELRKLFAGIDITEAHPVALLRAKDCGLCLERSWKQTCEQIGIRARHTEVQNLHERDAVLSAWAAREGFRGRWKHDLSKKRREIEQNPSDYWLSPVHYFWFEDDDSIVLSQ